MQGLVEEKAFLHVSPLGGGYGYEDRLKGPTHLPEQLKVEGCCCCTNTFLKTVYADDPGSSPGASQAWARFGHAKAVGPGVSIGAEGVYVVQVGMVCIFVMIRPWLSRLG